jgi:hypothetical protein
MLRQNLLLKLRIRSNRHDKVESWSGASELLKAQTTATSPGVLKVGLISVDRLRFKRADCDGNELYIGRTSGGEL